MHTRHAMWVTSRVAYLKESWSERRMRKPCRGRPERQNLLFGKHPSLAIGRDCHLIWKCNRIPDTRHQSTLEAFQNLAKVTLRTFLSSPPSSVPEILLMLAPIATSWSLQSLHIEAQVKRASSPGLKEKVTNLPSWWEQLTVTLNLPMTVSQELNFGLSLPPVFLGPPCGF